MMPNLDKGGSLQSKKHPDCPAAAKNWANEDLVELIGKVLKTDMDLDFLLDLNTRELEILLACIRSRIDQAESQQAAEKGR